VLLPIVIMLAVGAIDFARVYHTSLSMNSAAYAGAKYATHVTENANNTSVIELKVIENLENSHITSPVTIEVTNRCFCDEALTNEVDCDDDCPASAPPPAIYVDVRVSTQFTPIIDWPGLPDEVLVRGAAELRAN